MLNYVLATWPWRWLARWRWASHVSQCGRCSLVIRASGLPEWLCDDGQHLARRAHPQKVTLVRLV